MVRLWSVGSQPAKGERTAIAANLPECLRTGGLPGRRFGHGPGARQRAAMR